jgi:hypothetical protein
VYLVALLKRMRKEMPLPSRRATWSPYTYEQTLLLNVLYCLKMSKQGKYFF